MVKNVLRTKQGRALLAVFDGNKVAAARAWNNSHPDEPIGADGLHLEVTPETDSDQLQTLLDAGFDRDVALAALAEVAETPDVEDAPVGPLTSQEKSQVQVAKRGLVYVKGRVYVRFDLIEAAVRVLKTGKPEIVDVPGDHRTRGVALYRLEDGETVALQNLGQGS